MSKKDLLFFLIENTSIGGLTTKEDVKEKYLKRHRNINNLEMLIEECLRIIYDNELVVTDDSYNITINTTTKSFKILEGTVRGVYKKVNIDNELKNLENRIQIASKNGNIIKIICTNNEKIEYLVPNKSVNTYLTKFKRIERLNT